MHHVLVDDEQVQRHDVAGTRNWVGNDYVISKRCTCGWERTFTGSVERDVGTTATDAVDKHLRSVGALAPATRASRRPGGGGVFSVVVGLVAGLFALLPVFLVLALISGAVYVVWWFIGDESGSHCGYSPDAQPGSAQYERDREKNITGDC